MSPENTPEVTTEVATEAPRKTIKSIKSAAKSSKGTTAARRAAAERLPRTADVEQPTTADPDPTPEAPAGQRWLAYMGPEETKICYRTATHLHFKPTSFSNGHPVVLVPAALGEELIRFGVIKTYASGKARSPEDWVEAYAWLDDVLETKTHAVRRYGAVG